MDMFRTVLFWEPVTNRLKKIYRGFSQKNFINYSISLTNQEKYIESHGKEREIRLPDISPDIVTDRDKMIHILYSSGVYRRQI